MSKMNIGLIDVDKTKFPNLALMKIERIKKHETNPKRTRYR